MKATLEEIASIPGTALMKYSTAVRCRVWPVADSKWRELDQERFREAVAGITRCIEVYKEVEDKVLHLKEFRRREPPVVRQQDTPVERLAMPHPAVADPKNGFGKFLREAEAALNHAYLILQVVWALDQIFPHNTIFWPMPPAEGSDAAGAVAIFASMDAESVNRELMRIRFMVTYEASNLKKKWDLVCCEDKPDDSSTCWACWKSPDHAIPLLHPE